jgi:hypothetical protein
MDRQKSVLLLLFFKPDSRWGISLRVEKLPKSYKIPQASLYRKVDGLYESCFLELLNTKIGRAGTTVSYYGLSLKGLLAGFIYAYVLFLDSKTPANLKEHTQLDELIKIFESAPGWSFFIDFLKWHRDRRIDLSRAEVDMAYFSLTLLLSILERPKDLSEQDFSRLAEHLKRFGMVPEQAPKDMILLLENSKKFFQELGESIIAPLRRLASRDSQSLARERTKS